MAKTHENRRDFIKILSSMSHNDINDYIKQHGKRPKDVLLCTVRDKIAKQ